MVIRPNCSLSWRGTVAVFSSISLVSLGVALSFLLRGYWLILPFAGLELALLATALYLAAWRSSLREVISIHGAEISVERGHRQPEQVRIFPRNWARIELIRPRHRGYPTRLLLRSHGREMEIGGCLNESERRRLAEDLRRWIRPAPVPLPAA